MPCKRQMPSCTLSTRKPKAGYADAMMWIIAAKKRPVPICFSCKMMLSIRRRPVSANDGITRRTVMSQPCARYEIVERTIMPDELLIFRMFHHGTAAEVTPMSKSGHKFIPSIFRNHQWMTIPRWSTVKARLKPLQPYQSATLSR